MCSSGEPTLTWKLAGEVSDDSDTLPCPRPRSFSAVILIRFVSSELNPAYVTSLLKDQTDSPACPMFGQDSSPGSGRPSLGMLRWSLFLIYPSSIPYTDHPSAALCSLNRLTVPIYVRVSAVCSTYIISPSLSA